MEKIAESYDRFALPQATDELLLIFYEELRRLAQARISRLAPGQTLTPTELVHEAYLRVNGDEAVYFEGRRHFFFVVSRAMRDILVDRARRRASQKRGGHFQRIELDKRRVTVTARGEDILALDQALEKLGHEKPDNALVVQLRYFAGLTVAEVAEVTLCSQATVKRRWNYARAWLKRELAFPAGGRNA